MPGPKSNNMNVKICQIPKDLQEDECSEMSDGEGINQYEEFGEDSVEINESEDEFHIEVRNEPIEDDTFEEDPLLIADDFDEEVDFKVEEPENALNNDMLKPARTSPVHPYKCNHCQKSFSRNVILKRHMALHSGKLPYKCSHCQQSFSLKSYLERHMFTHATYECAKCQKTFEQERHLQTHFRTHTDEQRPYRCLSCSKYFSQKVNLQRHLRNHTEKRLYQCSHCQQRFSQNGQLQVHIQRKHTEEVRGPRTLSGKLRWTVEMERLLINIWQEEIEQLRGAGKNTHVYRDMAQTVVRAGYDVSWKDVRTKIENLTKKYRQETNKMELYGGAPSLWQHYKLVHSLLGSSSNHNMEGKTVESESMPPADITLENTRTLSGQRRWSLEMELLLIHFWQENIEQLRGAGKNKYVYKDMAQSILEAGYDMSWKDVRTKMENLTKKYRQETNKMGQSGGVPSLWQHYKLLHSFLGPLSNQSMEKNTVEKESILPDMTVENTRTLSGKLRWSLEMELLLIHFWQENIEELRGARQNTYIYKDMAQSILEAGYEVSWKDVRTKMENLTKKYRLETNKIERSGAAQSLWQHYESLHSLIKQKHLESEREYFLKEVEMELEEQ